MQSLAGLGALPAVVTLQGQMNRFAKKAGWPILALTGGVGAGTIDMFRRLVADGALQFYAGSPAATGTPAAAKAYLEGPDPANPSVPLAGTIAAQLAYVANERGLPQWKSTAVTTSAVAASPASVPFVQGDVTALPDDVAPAAAQLWSKVDKYGYHIAGGILLIAAGFVVHRKLKDRRAASL